jgi:hypothetical protein
LLENETVMAANVGLLFIAVVLITGVPWDTFGRQLSRLIGRPTTPMPAVVAAALGG